MRNRKKMKPETKKTLSRVSNVSGMCLAVIPPVVAFIAQFPQELSPRTYDRAVSWFAVAILAICVLPFIKKIKEYVKSPDAYAIWCAVYVVFAAMQKIVDGIVVVAFVGMISNITAKGLFVLGNRLTASAKNDTSEAAKENQT